MTPAIPLPPAATNPYAHAISDALADARAALCCPRGATPAELAGHILMLSVYGDEDEQAYARDFAEDRDYDPVLALWLDVVMPPPVAVIPAHPFPALLPPEPQPGLVRRLMVGTAAAVFAVWLGLAVVLGMGAV